MVQGLKKQPYIPVECKMEDQWKKIERVWLDKRTACQAS